VAQVNPSRHQLFMVRKVDCPPANFTTDAENFQEADIILTLDGQLITRVSELDVMYEKEVLEALIVRDGHEMRIKVPTVPTEDLETDQAVVFCGAVLQKPHHAVRQQISKLHSEIYVSARVRSVSRLSIRIVLISTRAAVPHLTIMASRPPTSSPRSTAFRLPT
jgi:sporulation protein YlmC with PRC-barrel domain